MAYAYIMHIKLFAARIINIDHKTLDNGTRYNVPLCGGMQTDDYMSEMSFCQGTIISCTHTDDVEMLILA